MRLKTAFEMSEYSQPLNPVIRSDAGYAPPFRMPSVRPPPQKGFKEKDGDMLGEFYPYEPGDFRRSKYAQPRALELYDVPTEKLAGFVAALRKEATTPAARLAHTQRIGAPKVSAPPGPSISDEVKPKGRNFGGGIPGAHKTKL